MGKPYNPLDPRKCGLCPGDRKFKTPNEDRMTAVFAVHFMLEHPDWWEDNGSGSSYEAALGS